LRPPFDLWASYHPKRIPQRYIGVVNGNKDRMSLPVFQAGRRWKVKRVEPVPFTRVCQVLAKLIRRDRRNQLIVAVNIDADHRVRAIRVPQPAEDRVAVGSVMIAFPSRSWVAAAVNRPWSIA